MKVLLIVPEIRLDNVPYFWPFWAGIFASIVEQKGEQVAILDLNALRTKFPNSSVPNELIMKEIASENWDLVGIGGLTTTYKRIKELTPIIKKAAPNSILISGGGWATYNPQEILQLVPEIDMICIGEGEETFSEICDKIIQGKNDFADVKGICYRDNDEIKFSHPRSLISDLDTVPYPAYHMFETDIYFKYSSLPLSVEAINSKRRGSIVWERGCPRGCTFCSHNGMSRIDLQNIYGEGDRRKGEETVRMVDKENDTFQAAARWPTPEYAVKNVEMLYEKYNLDFISILDENMTSNLKWTTEFCEKYREAGLHEVVKWGTLGDAPSVAVKPDLIPTMIDAGCAYIWFGFESASDKVLNQDIKKGQYQMHLQKTIDTVKATKLRPIATFMIGNPNENMNDLLETVDFWIRNNIEVDPFICTPYVGSPLFFDYKKSILEQYDERLKIIYENQVNGINIDIEKEKIDRWELDALDKFMTECGNATDYTATVSQCFTVPELFALKRLMYKHDTRRMIQFAHKRFNEPGLEHWKISDKWKKYDPRYIAEQDLSEKIKISN